MITGRSVDGGWPYEGVHTGDSVAQARTVERGRRVGAPLPSVVRHIVGQTWQPENDLVKAEREPTNLHHLRTPWHKRTAAAAGSPTARWRIDAHGQERL